MRSCSMLTKANWLSGVIAILLLTTSACTPDVEQDEVTRSGFDSSYIRVDGEIAPDEAIAEHIAPYQQDLIRVMNERLTTSPEVMEVGQPETSLGNLAADILLVVAEKAHDGPVDIALMNHRGLRIPLPKGDITVGTIFELMPFENYMALLKFTGEQLQSIANELAIYGGEPISGMRMVIEGNQGHDITVGGEPVDPDQTYWLVTNEWMANGGGEVPTLWSPLERVDIPILIRDAFIEYLREIDQIEPVLDGRITIKE